MCCAVIRFTFCSERVSIDRRTDRPLAILKRYLNGKRVFFSLHLCFVSDSKVMTSSAKGHWTNTKEESESEKKHQTSISAVWKLTQFGTSYTLTCDYPVVLVTTTLVKNGILSVNSYTTSVSASNRFVWPDTRPNSLFLFFHRSSKKATPFALRCVTMIS